MFKQINIKSRQPYFSLRKITTFNIDELERSTIEKEKRITFSIYIPLQINFVCIPEVYSEVTRLRYLSPGTVSEYESRHGAYLYLRLQANSKKAV